MTELKNILQEMVEKVEGEDLFVYWQVTRGTAPRNHAFPDVKPNLWITITPMQFRNLKERVALTTMEDTPGNCTCTCNRNETAIAG